jgi:hypothetical protein
MSSNRRAARAAVAVAVFLFTAGMSARAAPCLGPPTTCNLRPHVPLAYPGRLQVFNLYWHQNWDQLPGHAGFQIGAIDRATAQLVASHYFDSLTQYNVPGFTFGGSTNTNTAAPCPKTPGAEENIGSMAAFLSCSEASGPLGRVPTQLAFPSPACVPCGSVPGPACLTDPICLASPNPTGTVIYNVFLPKGTRLNDAAGSSVSCRDYIAFHAQIPSMAVGGISGVAGGRPLYFTLIPVECASTIGDLMISVSHELVEAATDPLPLTSWFDASASPQVGTLDLTRLAQLAREGEVGDICAPLARTLTPTDGSASFQVAAYWSNAANSCVAMGPISPPPPGGCSSGGQPAILALTAMLALWLLARRWRRFALRARA